MHSAFLGTPRGNHASPIVQYDSCRDSIFKKGTAETSSSFLSNSAMILLEIHSLAAHTATMQA